MIENQSSAEFNEVGNVLAAWKRSVYNAVQKLLAQKIQRILLGIIGMWCERVVRNIRVPESIFLKYCEHTILLQAQLQSGRAGLKR